MAFTCPAVCSQTAQAGGIAYVAHVAGFAAGILLTLLLGARRRRWATA